jgi:hypothetical protein
MSTHDSVTVPVDHVGSAAGFFKTGQFLDYRRVGNPTEVRSRCRHVEYWGRCTTSFGNRVAARRNAPSEFERWGQRATGALHQQET